MTDFAQGYVRNGKPNRKLMDEAVAKAQEASVVLVFAGLDEVSECEGMDRTHMMMPQAQNELIQVLAANHKNVVVVLSAGSAVEMPWKNDVRAILHGYLGGQAGASAMLRVIRGKVNPSGKLNETYPYAYQDTPAYAYYPSKERTSEFRESIYVGYRYYESAGKAVNFPFGYGLSYTSFAYDNIKITKDGVSFTIKNTGRVDGAEVAQVYVGMESDTVFRPVKELKGFTKVFLKSGEEKEVTIPFDDKTFRFFDVTSNSWQIETGT
jgi:beta-glucosidase